MARLFPSPSLPGRAGVDHARAQAVGMMVWFRASFSTATSDEVACATPPVPGRPSAGVRRVAGLRRRLCGCRALARGGSAGIGLPHRRPGHPGDQHLQSGRLERSLHGRDGRRLLVPPHRSHRGGGVDGGTARGGVAGAASGGVLPQIRGSRWRWPSTGASGSSSWERYAVRGPIRSRPGTSLIEVLALAGIAHDLGFRHRGRRTGRRPDVAGMVQRPAPGGRRAPRRSG